MSAPIAKFIAVAFCSAHVVGFAGHGWAQSTQAWKVTTRQSDALAETRIGNMYVRLSGQCKSGSSSVVVTLEGYRGNALRKVDQVEQPVTFVAEGRDGSRTEHRGAMFMFGDEVAMPNSLPTSFVERLAESDRLLIRNASGQPILTVSLAGARQFSQRLAHTCGTAKAQAEKTQAASLTKPGRQCYSNGSSTLDLRVAADGSGQLRLSHVSGAMHICEIKGKGVKTAQGWRVSGDSGCRLDLIVSGRRLSAHDPGRLCKQAYCGVRADFSDMVIDLARHRQRC